MLTAEQATIKPRQAGQVREPSLRCEWCNGYGYVDDPMNVTIPCISCDGTGLNGSTTTPHRGCTMESHTQYRIYSTEQGHDDVTHGWTRKHEVVDIVAAAMRKRTGKRHAWYHIQHFTGGSTYHVQGGYQDRQRVMTPVHVLQITRVD